MCPGRIKWDRLGGFFPSDWEPSYYHALQRIAMIMRQAMDWNQIGQGEFRRLIRYAEAVVEERRRKANAVTDTGNAENVDSDGPSPSTQQQSVYVCGNYVELWNNFVNRLKAIANTTELSIDDLAL
jgi:hypothetical protein